MQEITLAQVVKALGDIQAELHQINKTLAAMATQAKATPRTASEAPSRPAPRAKGGYARAESGSSEEDGPFGRFTRKKAPSRAKGKLPPKKGGGYPKKPR